MEMGFGLCTLAALMWLLWWNGFGEIHEDQLSLRYFREILSLLVLGQLTGVLGILREKWLAKSIRNPRWMELGLGLLILVMLAGNFFNSTFISRIELQNIFRALCLCYGAAPLLNLKEYFFRLARRNRGFHLPRIRPALLFLLTLIAFITLGEPPHVARRYQGRHHSFPYGRLFHQHQRRLRHGARAPERP